MRKAHYMKFLDGHHGGLDRLGGLPTHLPPTFPLSLSTGQDMTFLGQFYCHPGRLELDGVLCVQLYQGPPEDEPCPVVVVVPIGAPINSASLATQHLGPPFDITWEERDDPDEVENWQTELAASKAGGTCYFWGMIQPGERLLLQLWQQPGQFNFGGYTAVVVQTTSGELEVRLG
jgi:hypothetical protein